MDRLFKLYGFSSNIPLLLRIAVIMFQQRLRLPVILSIPKAITYETQAH